MSEKRELHILYGKLLSDLDLNGHKLLGLNIPEGGGGGGSSVIVDDTLTQDGENPVKSKGIWSAIWGAISAPAASVYAWVTTELKKKQNALSQEQMAAVDSGITAEKVEKLNGVEAGAQKNPDLSGYAKKSDIPAAPDLSEYAKTAEVPAAIAGKEIKPSRVVVENDSGFGWIDKAVEITPDSIYYIKHRNEDYIEKELFISWEHILNSIPKYNFVDYGESGGTIQLFPFAIRRVSGTGEDISISISVLEGSARDVILVVDATAETHILWEDGATTFHPRGGDASNLEVVAGKRNVFFITEVQPNVFMVARDELELQDAGGGE